MAIVLFDCEKCYEKVRLRVAAEKVYNTGFPAKVLAVCLCQDGADRALTFDGATGCWQKIESGIIAGCGMARHILEGVLLGPMAG
eukprot:15466533-Alexandrium_andersonii.AAC.1